MFIRKNHLLNIAGSFFGDSPDIVYEFDLLAEYFRLEKTEDSKVVQDLAKFLLEMNKAVEKKQIILPKFDFFAKYDSFAIEVMNIDYII